MRKDAIVLLGLLIILSGCFSQNTFVEPDEDPIESLNEGKLEAMINEMIKQNLIVMTDKVEVSLEKTDQLIVLGIHNIDPVTHTYTISLDNCESIEQAECQLDFVFPESTEIPGGSFEFFDIEIKKAGEYQDVNRVDILIKDEQNRENYVNLFVTVG